MSVNWARSGSRSGWYLKTAVVVVVVLIGVGFSTHASQQTPATGPESTISWKPKIPWPKSKPPVDLYDTVANETLGFQKIFAITLPSRVDQRDALSLAGALTGVKVDLVDGVSEVDGKTLPPSDEDYDPNENWLRAWRAHLDTLRMIVRENITSALIMEGDADWDIRIKSQMRDFAHASRLLSQHRIGTDQFLDPTYPKSESGQIYQDFPITDEALVERAQISPYGDNWDVLWLGHCGATFPFAEDEVATPPLGRVPYFNDETVPAKEHIDTQWGPEEIKDQYPSHTRVVSRTRENVCSIAYAVSQTGARRILYELGIRRIEAAFDLSLRAYCDGIDGRRVRLCLTVQPTLFAQHRRAGSNAALSDIAQGEGTLGRNEIAFTRNVRWSAQTNLAKLVEGETDYIDWPRDG